MEATLTVGVILVSIREGRRGEAIAAWALSLLENRTDIQPRLSI